MACESSRAVGRKQEEDARESEARPFRAESSQRAHHCRISWPQGRIPTSLSVDEGNRRALAAPRPEDSDLAPGLSGLARRPLAGFARGRFATARPVAVCDRLPLVRIVSASESNFAAPLPS